MIRADLLVVGADEIATLDVGPVPRVREAMSEVGRIPHGVLGVDRGRVVFVGAPAEARGAVRLRSGGSRWELDGGTIVPGFVDAHTHVLFGGSRHRELEEKIQGVSYGEIARRGGGLYSTVRATRSASAAALLRAASERIRRMARDGTTTAEVKSGYALTVPGELRLLELIPRLARRTGIRLVPTFLGAHAVPPEYAGRGDAYIELLIRKALPVIARRRLARFCDVFCEPGFFSVRQAGRLLRAAASLGLGIKIHADEFVFSGGARLAARLGATSAEHLLATGATDRVALARAGVTAVLLPVTPFASMARLASPGRAMVDDGVPVALGSDCSPNSWIESMPLVLSHAVYGARLTPAEALTAATVNAAHASGVERLAGRIALGRPAEFVVFDVPSADHLAYRIGLRPTAVYRQGTGISSR
jgi:imidazolonepropionase